MRSPEAIIPLVLAALLVFSMIIFFVTRARKERFLRLAGLLDDRPQRVRGFMAMRLEGRYRDRPAVFGLVPGGKNHPPSFHTALGCQNTLRFEISRESVLTRIAAKLRLVRDLEIGDPNLDPAFVFSTEDEDRFRSWLRGSGDARQALRSLMEERGVDRLKLRDGLLTATQTRHGRDHMEPDRVRDVLDRMETLVRTLEGGA